MMREELATSASTSSLSLEACRVQAGQEGALVLNAPRRSRQTGSSCCSSCAVTWRGEERTEGRDGGEPREESLGRGDGGVKKGRKEG